MTTTVNPTNTSSAMASSSYVLIWAVPGERTAKILYRELFLFCPLAEALDTLNLLARRPSFIMGQLLDNDGEVVANQAPVSVDIAGQNKRWPGVVLNLIRT